MWRIVLLVYWALSLAISTVNRGTAGAVHAALALGTSMIGRLRLDSSWSLRYVVVRTSTSIANALEHCRTTSVEALALADEWLYLPVKSFDWRVVDGFDWGRFQKKSVLPGEDEESATLLPWTESVALETF